MCDGDAIMKGKIEDKLQATYPSQNLKTSHTVSLNLFIRDNGQFYNYFVRLKRPSITTYLSKER